MRGPAPGGPPPDALGPPGFGPGGGLPPGLDARPYLGRILKRVLRHKRLVLGTVTVTLLITALPFVVSATFGPLLQVLATAAAQGSLERVWDLSGSLYGRTDEARPDGPQAWLAAPIPFGVLFLAWALALISQSPLGFARSWIEAKLDARLLSEVRQEVNDHLQSMSLDFFTTGRTGALMQRVLQESMAVQRIITEVLLTPAVDVVVSTLALLYLLSLSWQMTLVAFVLAPMTVLMFRYTSKRLQGAAMAVAMTGRELSAELEETLSGIGDIQVFNAQPRQSARFGRASRLAATASANMKAWITFSNGGSQAFIALSTTLVLLLGILFGTAFGLTFATLVVFVQFVPNLFGPIQRIIASYTMYQSLIPNVVATYQLLDTKPSITEPPDAHSIGEVHGHIVFDGVVFGYLPGQRILDGMSFEIREGETVALIGPIGCGKSTVFNLLLRFLELSQGRVLLDGQDIAGVTFQSLREQVSKLSQFPFFLKDTIRENVRLARAQATDAEVDEACREAHVHDVIVDPTRIPHGYDTIVDVQVPSGGQKRLIALARCLLRRPEVLLLDEPTENLDADQRNRLVDVIRGYALHRTCLVISHDMDFIASVADRVLVMNEGRIVEDGTHAELMAHGGLYKTLYDLQNVDPALRRVREPVSAPMGPPGMPPGGPMMGMPMGRPPG